MSARYQIVHYIPDPFSGGRIPLAALVEMGGRASIVKIDASVGLTCLGGSHPATVEMILEDLDEAREFGRLPPSIGPNAVLDVPREIPDGVSDPTQWVSAILAMNREHVASRRQPRRATYGYRFFRNYGVHNYVRKSFRPGADLDGWLSEAEPLGSISHYVPGKKVVMLLEPIAPFRPNWEAELRAVANRFGAYKHVIQDLGLGQEAKLYAYVLAGGTTQKHELTREHLAGFADDVVDTEVPRQRGKFLDEIREIGGSLELPLR